MSKARHPQMAAPGARAAGRWRRGDLGGLSSGFLTLSVLLLVMALGFVFGRVVIARAYIKAAPPINRNRAGAPPPPVAAQDVPQVVYGQGGVPAGPAPAAPSAPRPMNPSDVPTGDTASDGADTGADASGEAAPAPEAGDTGGSNAGDVRYAVQVGVFSSEQRARQAADQLTRAGYSARIEVSRDPSQTGYRVLAGRYRSEANARKALDQIRREGFPEAFVVGQ